MGRRGVGDTRSEWPKEGEGLVWDGEGDDPETDPTKETDLTRKTKEDRTNYGWVESLGKTPRGVTKVVVCEQEVLIVTTINRKISTLIKCRQRGKSPSLSSGKICYSRCTRPYTQTEKVYQSSCWSVVCSPRVFYTHLNSTFERELRCRVKARGSVRKRFEKINSFELIDLKTFSRQKWLIDSRSPWRQPQDEVVWGLWRERLPRLLED